MVTIVSAGISEAARMDALKQTAGQYPCIVHSLSLSGVVLHQISFI